MVFVAVVIMTMEWRSENDNDRLKIDRQFYLQWSQ